MSKLHEIESSLEMNTRETKCHIQLESANGSKLTSQAILDAVSDMLFTYYGVSPEQWNTLVEDKNLDS